MDGRKRSSTGMGGLARKGDKKGLPAPAQGAGSGNVSTTPINRTSVDEDARPQWGATMTLKTEASHAEKIKRSSSPRGSIIVKDKDTPSDFIFKTLLGEFRELAKKKIEDIMTERIDTISLLSDVFDAAEDPIFSQLVEALSQLSENCVPFLIRALINWKSNQQFLASQTFKPPAGLAKVSAKDTIQVLDERLKLAVDYIFGTTLLAVLKHSSAKDTLRWLESGSGLDEDLAAQLETMCFDHFRPGTEKPSKGVDSGLVKALSANRREIPELYAQILGLLSRHRLGQMTAMLFREIISPSAKGPQLTKSTTLLEGVRYVQLRLDTKPGLDQAHNFVSRYFDLFKHKSRNLKTQLSRTIVSIFTPLVKQQPYTTGLDYSAWHTLISSIFLLYSKKLKKSRSIQTWYPLLANLLCLCDNTVFLSQFWPFVETLTKLLKDKANKPVALESLYLILLTYLTKHTEPAEQQTKRLATITSHIFPSGTWKGQSEATDTIYIDIISIIAHNKLDYAMNKIIFDLLRSEPFCPERVGIGIHGLLSIVCNLENGGGFRDPFNASQNAIPQRPPAAIKEYMPTINFCFSSILSTLDKICGQLTLLHSSKQAQETLQKEKAALHLLRTVLSCIPFCYPTATSTDKLMNMLGRHLIHLDRYVREQALAALSRMMKACPLLRPAVVHGVADMVLSIPDTNDKLLYHALHKLSNLLHQWPRGTSDSLVYPDDADVFDVRYLPDDPVTGASTPLPSTPTQSFDPVPEMQVEMLRHFHPHRVEAVALVFLCLPYPNIRALAIEILQSVRSIANALSEAASREDGDDEEELTPTRVMDIIDETGPDVVNRLNQDYRFRRLFQMGLPNIKSLERLWSSQSNEDQIFWTYCLGALMPLTLNLCPEAINTAWHIVCSRMKHVKPEDKSPVSPEEVEHAYAWQNYSVVACATVSDYVVKSVGPGRHRIDCWPASVADLFNFILPLLKSDLHWNAAVMALERCNYSAYDVLFETLRPYEQEYMRRRRKGVDQLRNHVSYIYYYISETWRQGTLVESENLRQVYLAYIQETTKYLSQPAAESILDNHQALRYNICGIIGNVARELSLQSNAELFEISQRKQLFYFLLNWCRGEAMLQDEQTKRQLTSTLGQTRGADKKNAYEKFVRDQTLMLQHQACSAAGALLLGRVFDEEAVHPNGSVFAWVNSLLEQKERKKLHSLGRMALEGFLQNCNQYPQLLETAINQCYSTNPSVARGYFLALVELFKSQDVAHPLPVLLLLILFKAGDAAIVLRRNAIQLLQLVVPENLRYSPLPINSLLDVTYRRSQYELSQLLANQNPGIVGDITVEMVRRLEMCEAQGQKQLLGLLIPWLQCLNRHLHDPNCSPNLELIVENLLLITLLYADDHPLHVQQLWITLADQEENIANVINFLLDLGAKKRNPAFVTLAKKVIIWFGREKPEVTVNTLVTRLSSFKPATNKSGGSVVKKSPESPPSSVRSTYLPSAFSSVMPDIVAYSTPARGHLALIFLAELAFEVSHEFLPHLPVIMHQVFLGFDYPQTAVFEHCRVLLLNLIHSVVVQDIESREEMPEELEEYREAADLEEYLKMREGKQLWLNEDISLRKVELASSRELIRLAERVVKVFARSKVSLAEEWATEALTWAISCPSYHLVNRSYQMYRALLPYAKEVKITPIDMLESMLVRISDRTSENLSVSLEILLTLQGIVDTMDTAKLWLYPQIFWAAIALLHSDFEQEFHQAIKLLTKIITRFKGFSDIAAQNVFLTYSPKGWDPPFEDVQKLVLRGVLSVETLASSVELLSKFTPMQSDKLFEPEPLRLQSNILGLVVYMGLHVGEENGAHECYGMAAALTEACMATSQNKLGKIFSHYRKKQYPTMEAFFEELAKAFVEAFFPMHAARALNFLFDVLDKLEENWKGGSAVAAAGYHKAVLVLLRFLTAEVDLTFPMPHQKVAKWLSCLARFVTANSSLWKDALRVLECIVHRSELSLSQIFTANFRPLQYRALRSEFADQVHKGNAQVRDTLKLVLKSADQKEKASLISREFFEWMLKLSPEEEAEEESGAQSPLEVNEDSEEDEIDLTEFQDVFNVFGGIGSPADKIAHGRTPRPGGPLSPPEIDDNLSGSEKEKNSKGELNGNKKGGKGERNSDVAGSGDESAESSTLHGSDEITTLGSGGAPEAEMPVDIRSVSRRWRKLSEQRKFNSEADLFEIFPIAGQLLNLVTLDYREHYRADLEAVPSPAEKRLLQAPVFNADALDLPLFQAPIFEAKRSVLFTIVCSKYRSLAEANVNFARTFAEKRAQLVEAFNQQQRVYLEQKADVDAKRAKLPRDPDQEPDPARSRLSVVQFCMGVVRLHYQLLRLYQINCSLQQLVTGLLDSPEALGDESEEAEKQRSLLEKEMDKNTAVARQLTAKERELISTLPEVKREPAPS